MPRGRPRYRFAEFTLSPARRSLRRGAGREVPLIPRYLDLLVLLVERRAVALHRQEIFDRVVGGRGRLRRRPLPGGEDAAAHARRGGRAGVHPDRLAARVPVRVPGRRGGRRRRGRRSGRGNGSRGSLPGGRRGRPAARGPRAAPRSRARGRRAARRRGGAARARYGEALRRLDRAPGHARAWAYLRDSRWDVAGAGKVPLLAPPAGPAAWAALAGLRLRRALRLAGSRWAAASAGGAVAGALAGLLGGLAMSVLGGSAAPSLLAALAVVGCGGRRPRARRGRLRARRGRGARALVADPGPHRARRRSAAPSPGRPRAARSPCFSRRSSASTGSPPAAASRGSSWAPPPASASASPRGGWRTAWRRPAGVRGRERSPPPPSRARSPPPACPSPGAVSGRRVSTRSSEPSRRPGCAWPRSGGFSARKASASVPSPPSASARGSSSAAGLAAGLTRRPRRLDSDVNLSHC